MRRRVARSPWLLLVPGRTGCAGRELHLPLPSSTAARMQDRCMGSVQREAWARRISAARRWGQHTHHHRHLRRDDLTPDRTRLLGLTVGTIRNRIKRRRPVPRRLLARSHRDAACRETAQSGDGDGRVPSIEMCREPVGKRIKATAVQADEPGGDVGPLGVRGQAARKTTWSRRPVCASGMYVGPLPSRASSTAARWSTGVLQVRLACPDITRACDLARAFADLVRHQCGYLLLEWIRQAEQDAPKPIKCFAGFLRQDLDAVTAGLTLPWSSGVVEGHVNRVKTLKRAMYGRASFELLRARILTQP
ncbi:transposase [Streptomyces griseorubiginosus]|uniref:transposase n=1 Tax=Streptomyces griseorubiginosus TaxID=67304 RepID=UPI0033F6BD5E